MSESELRALTPEQLVERLAKAADIARQVLRLLPMTKFTESPPPGSPYLFAIGDFVICARYPDLPKNSSFFEKGLDVPPPGGG